MASYGKESIVRLTLLMGILLAVLGGQFMSGLSRGTSVGTEVSAADTVSPGIVATGQVRPLDDRWGV